MGLANEQWSSLSHFPPNCTAASGKNTQVQVHVARGKNKMLGFQAFLLLASSIYSTRTSEALQLQEIEICCFIPAFQTNQAPLVVKPLTAGSLQQSCIRSRELNEWKQQLVKGEISKQGLKRSLLSFEGF